MPCKSCGKDSGKFYEGSCPECLVERVRELEIANASVIGAVDGLIIETRRLQAAGGRLEASCAALQEALRKATGALNAPTHEANDLNCQDWPPGEVCRGCAGDDQRELAIKQIEAALSATAGTDLLRRLEKLERLAVAARESWECVVDLRGLWVPEIQAVWDKLESALTAGRRGVERNAGGGVDEVPLGY